MNNKTVFETEVLVACANRVGENPLWDERRQCLFWCDILAGEIYQWNSVDETHRTIYRGELCGAFALCENGELLLLRDREAVVLNVETGQVRVLAREIVGYTGRFNDCFVDPKSRIFTGTIDPVDDQKGNDGALFCLDLGGSTSVSSREIFRGTACSNGLALTPDLTRLYWSDSTSQTIFCFDYDLESGQATNMRSWLPTPGHTPDGLSVDVTGNVWIAYFGQSEIRCLSPEAELKCEIRFPTSKITSCTFGGPNMDELFVTSAGGTGSDETAAGHLFRVRYLTKGQAKYRCRLADVDYTLRRERLIATLSSED